MKKALAMTIVLLLILTALPPSKAMAESVAFGDTVTFTAGSKIVRVNGVVSYIPVAPVIQSGRLFLPLRAAAEKFKATVTWDDFMGRIDVRTKEEIDLEYKIGDKKLYVTEPYNAALPNQWYEINMDVAPFLKNGRTFVPMRYFAQGIGALVSYDAKSKTVTIKRISTDGWRIVREPHTGVVIRFPGSWKVESQKPYLELSRSGNSFVCTYEDKSQANVISSARKVYVQEGWKVSQDTGSFLKLTKFSGPDQFIKIISTRKYDQGSLVFTIDMLYVPSELDLLIFDKMTPGFGI